MSGADDLRALGYEYRGGRWYLVNPDAKPALRSRLCKGCQKFRAHPDWDGLCAGCLWFGLGDPHGLKRRTGDGEREVLIFRPRYVEDEDLTLICWDCKGYMSTGLDGLCDGCAWLAAPTSLSFSEWRDAQEQAAWRLKRLRGKAS